MRGSRLIWQSLFVAGILALLVILKTQVDYYLEAQRNPALNAIWAALGVLAAVVALAVLITGAVRMQAAVGRVRRVLKALDEIRQGKYPKVVVEGRDELAELTRGFNQAVEELRTRDEKLKSWMGYREVEVVRLSQTLEAERERLGTVLDSIGDGVIVLDSEGKVLMANRRVSEVFGVPLEMLTRTDLSKLIQQVRH